MADVRDVIDDYIIVIDRYREEELGRVYKAFNINLKTSSRYVAFLQLHEWCSHLSADLQKNLIAAVKAASHSVPSTTNLSCSTVTCVLDAWLFSEAPIKNEIPARDRTKQSIHYVVTEWIEEVPVRELFDHYIRTPHDALKFVHALTDKLSMLYSKSADLRPEINIEQVWRKGDFSTGVDALVLKDWGFAAVLDKTARSEAHLQEDVRRLVRLLLQLLDGCWLYHAQQLPREKYLLSSDLAKLRHQYHSSSNIKLWSILEEAERSVMQLETFADQLKDTNELARPLKLMDKGSAKQSVDIGGEASASDTEHGVEETAVADKPTVKPDILEINDPREPDAFFRQVLVLPPQELTEQPEKYSEIFAIGQGVLFDQTGRQIKKDHDGSYRLKSIKFFIEQRRLYLQRHKSTGIDGGYHYYTLADFGYTGDRGNTWVDDIKISPLFTVLVTANSKIEVATRDQRTHYQLKLKPADGMRLSGWAAAKSNGLFALSAEQQRYTITPGMQTIDLPVQIMNPTDEVDQLTVVADGLPADWQRPRSQQVRLFNKESAKVILKLDVPVFRFRKSHDIVVRLISDNVSAQVAAVAIQIEVPPHFDFVGFLQPESLRVSTIGNLEIQNKGNLQQDFFISLRDKDNELIFEPPEMLVAIPSQQAGVVSYRTHVRHWRLLGREKTHEIIAIVAPQNGGVARTLTGQVRSRAIIPAWAPIFAILLLVGIFLLFSLFFVPELAQASVSVNNKIVDTPYAGERVDLQWTALNTCFYSIYQNGRALVWRKWQSDSSGHHEITRTNPGDVLEVRLHSCTLLNTKPWQVEVQPAPTARPVAGPLPVIAAFNLTVEDIEIPRVNAQGEFTTQPAPQPAVPQLLVGQVGELCFAWNVIGKNADDGYTIQLAPIPDGFTAAALAAATGKVCLPIATTYKKPENTTYTLSIVDAIQKPVSKEIEQAVQVFPPLCSVNTEVPLLLREGPGRDYDMRGELPAGSRVIPLGRPVFLYVENEPDQWVPVTLPSDPRPAWVAYRYLYCPVDIAVLPPVEAIPPTPTTTPTTTPQPTATPTPDLQPEITIEPQVILLGGCAIFKWKIQNVRNVYLDEEGVVGEAEKTVCPSETGQLKYTWKIEKLDGSIQQLERILIVNPNGTPTAFPPPPS